MFQKLLLTLLTLGLFACADQSVDKYKERAEAEQEGSTKVENEALAEKAKAMERDLTSRHAFYGALEGEYEGSLTVDDEVFKIKLVFARSILPYTENRVRQLSEIENDLNNLYFHMQVVQWHPADPASAVGCRVSGLRPSMNEGTLTVASPDCPNLYSMFLSEGTELIQADALQMAKIIAAKLKKQELVQISHLQGNVQPSSHAAKYKFLVQKLK